MTEVAYAKSRFRPPEIEHRYGSNVHVLDDPLAWTLLALAAPVSRAGFTGQV